MNLPVGAPHSQRTSIKKVSAKLNKVANTPASLQKIIHTSTISDIGESLTSDTGVDSSQVSFVLFLLI